MKTKNTSTKSLGHFNYETVVMGLKADADDNYAKLISRDVRLKRLFETIKRTEGNILDIGSGGGTISNCLSFVYPHANVYGCDVSRAAISLAKKHARPRTAFALIQSGKFPYKDKFFDVCVCFDVLEHVPDVEEFLSETRRVLKKGGEAFFAVPCEGQPFSVTWFLRALKFGHMLTYKHVGHIHPEFTHDYVKDMFVRNGFAIVGVTYGEHFITQCVRFIRFILPKEILEFVLGSGKAQGYYDRAIVTNTDKKRPVGVFHFIRILWLKLSGIFDFIENAEAYMLKDWEFSAWKVFLHARKTS